MDMYHHPISSFIVAKLVYNLFLIECLIINSNSSKAENSELHISKSVYDTFNTFIIVLYLSISIIYFECT
jgi:hypothetical protein